MEALMNLKNIKILACFIPIIIWHNICLLGEVAICEFQWEACAYMTHGWEILLMRVQLHGNGDHFFAVNSWLMTEKRNQDKTETHSSDKYLAMCAF